MICRVCGTKMALSAVLDTGTNANMNDNNIAFNVYICPDCSTLARENLWDFKGVVWVYSDGRTKVEA